MSDSMSTESPRRQLRSPFDGNLWPPDVEGLERVSVELYEELMKRGFVPVEPKRGPGRPRKVDLG